MAQFSRLEAARLKVRPRQLHADGTLRIESDSGSKNVRGGSSGCFHPLRSLNEPHIVEEHLGCRAVGPLDFETELVANDDLTCQRFVSACPNDVIANGEHASLRASHESALPPIL
jgi:hypothetical protein